MPRHNATPTPHKIHIPLSSELYDWLKAESQRTGQPSTLLARQALERLRYEQEKRRWEEDTRAFVEAYGGTELDLDPDLEEAGLESLERYLTDEAHA